MLKGNKKTTILLFGDFYIMDVKYDETTGLVSEVLICEPRNFLPGAPFWINREAAISLIEDGYYLELYPPVDQPLLKRWFIQLVKIGEMTYLRTDHEAIAADSLAWTGC